MLAVEDKNVIPTISDRLSHAVNIQDRRAAVKALKNFANYYREEIILYALKNILKCFQRDQLDKEITKNVLQCLLVLFIKNESRGDLSDWLSNKSRFQNGKYVSPSVILAEDTLIDQFSYLIADELTQSNTDIVELIINSFEFNDFYISLYSLQLLQAMISTRPEKTKEIISLIPVAIPNITANIDSDHDPIRNESILLLMAIVNNNYNLQRVVAFQDIFQRLFKVIDLESSISFNNIVIQDCFTLIYNLLNSNVTNQKLFLVSNNLTDLSRYLELLSSDDPAIANNMFNQQLIDNIVMILKIVSVLFISRENSISFNDQVQSSKILINILKIIFLNYIPNQIKSGALFALADLLFYNEDLKAQLITIDVPYLDPMLPNINDTSEQNTLVPVLQLLLNWCLFNNSIHIFDIRLGSFQVLKSYFSNSPTLKHNYLNQQIEAFHSLVSQQVDTTLDRVSSHTTPTTGRASIDDNQLPLESSKSNTQVRREEFAVIDNLIELKIPVANIFVTLLEYDPDIKLNPYKVWFASLLLSYLVNDSFELKKIIGNLKLKNFNDDDLFDDFFNDNDENDDNEHKSSSIDSSPVAVKGDGADGNKDVSNEEYVKVETDESEKVKGSLASNGGNDNADKEAQQQSSESSKSEEQTKQSSEEPETTSEKTSEKSDSANENESEVIFKGPKEENKRSIETTHNASETLYMPEMESTYSDVKVSGKLSKDNKDDDLSNFLTAIDAMLDLLINSLEFEDKRIAISYLMFLTNYFFENISLIRSFIRSDVSHKTEYLKKLILFVKQENNGDVILVGMVNVLLGILYDSCPKYLHEPASATNSDEQSNFRFEYYDLFQKTIGVDTYKIALKNFKKNELFSRFEELDIFEVQSFDEIEKDNTGLPKIYFNEIYTNLVKENFMRILNAFNNDPNAEPNGVLNFSDFLNLSNEVEVAKLQLEEELQTKTELDSKIKSLSEELKKLKDSYDSNLKNLKTYEKKNKDLTSRTEKETHNGKVFSELVQTLKKDKSEKEAKIKALESDKAKLESEKSNLTAANKKFEEGVNKMSRELFQFTKKDQENNSKIAALNKQIQNDTKAFENKSNEFKKQISALEIKVKEFETKNSNLSKQIGQMENEKAELQKGFANYERNLINDLNTMSFKLNQVTAEKEQVDNLTFQLNKEIETLKGKIEHLNKDNDMKTAEYQAQVSLLTKKGEEAAKLIIDLELIKKAHDELVSKQADNEKSINKKEANYKQQITSLQKDLETAKKSNSEEVETLTKTLESRNAVIDELRSEFGGKENELQATINELEQKVKGSLENSQLQETKINKLTTSFEAQKKELSLAKKDASDNKAKVVDLEKQIRQKQKDIDKLQANLKSKELAASSSAKELKSLKDEISAKGKEIESLKDDIVSRESKATKNAQELELLQKDFEEKDTLVKKLESKIGLQKDKVSDLEEDIKKHKEKAESLAKDIVNHQHTINTLEKDVKQHKDKAAASQKDAGAHQDKLENLQSIIKSKETKIAELETTITKRGEKVSRLEAEILEKEEKVDELKSEIKESIEKITSLEEQLRAKEAKVSDFEVDLQEKDDKISSLEDDLKNRDATIENLESSLNKTKELGDAAQSEKLVKEKEAKEKAAKEKAAKEQQAQNKVAREKEAKQQAAAEKAEREKELKAKAKKIVELESQVKNLKKAEANGKELYQKTKFEKEALLKEKIDFTKQIDALKEEKETLFEKKEQEIKETKEKLVSDNIEVLKAKDNEIKEVKEILLNENAEALKAKNSEIENIKKEMADKDLENKEILVQEKVKLQKSLTEEHTSKLSALKEKLIKLEAQLKELTAKELQKEKQLLALEQKLADRETELQQLKTKQEKAEQSHKESVSSFKEKESSLEQKLFDLKQANEKSNEHLKTKLEEKQEANQKLEFQIDTIIKSQKDKEVEGSKKHSALERQISELKEQLINKDREFEKENRKVEVESKTKEEMVPKSELDDLVLLMSELDDKVKTYKKKLKELNVEVSDDESGDSDDDDSDDESEDDE